MDDKDERRWIIGIIEDGKKSDYWKLLEKSILQWIEEENIRLDSYKTISILSDDEVEKYNRAVDRFKYLKRFLTINETIIGYQKSFIEKFKENVINLINNGESFFEKVTGRQGG